jgi:large subunit ribosomal protein L25
MEVEIELFSRKKTKKSENNRLRREGKIPCVVYSKGAVGVSGTVNRADIDACLRKLEYGFLPTTVFLLKNENGKITRAIIKEMQYEVTTYKVNHIDFFELTSDEIDLKVPVRCLGGNDCPGVKAGGFLRQVWLHVPVSCLPQNIPASFNVDVKDLEMRQAKRVRDLSIPQGVRVRIPENEVIATVIK